MRKLLKLAMSLTGVSIVAGAALIGAEPGAEAGAPQDVARNDVVPVAVTADATSLLGDDTVTLIGWVNVSAGAARTESGAQVRDLRIDSMRLRGASRLGLVAVAGQEANASLGELRSLQPGSTFPASAAIDLFFDVSFPSTPFGAFLLRNQAPIRVEATVDAWPPLGATLLRVSDSDCISLVESPPDTETGLGLCLRSLRLTFAPELPGFSVGRDGPSQLHAADVLALAPAQASPDAPGAPVVRFTCAALGLSADGCDDGADGDSDNISALSYGVDLKAQDEGAAPASGVEFSVAAGTQGVVGSAVAVQANCPPGAPGASPEPEGDVFTSPFDSMNKLLFDGNGPVGACEDAFSLGLVEAAGGHDNLDALAGDPSLVDADGDGVPERPVYFALDALSPSLANAGFSAGDVLMSVNGGPATRFASASQLGLVSGDALDGMCLQESGDGTFGLGDEIVFSLAPGSPSLATIGAGPADLLAAGSPPVVLHRSTALGLVATDDVDALACSEVLDSLQQPGDVDCSGATDGIDAMIILQWHAGLLAQLPCAANGDVDGSGAIDSRDAALVLQYEAGLLERLPV